MGFLLKSDISSQQELCQLVNYNKIVTLEIFFFKHVIPFMLFILWYKGTIPLQLKNI